jgi:hypothetical protein
MATLVSEAVGTQRSVIPFERRSACRFHTVMRVAKVTRANDVGLWRVRNMSDEGMMLLTHVRVTEGEPLSIALSATIILHGRAVWWDGERCGVEFDAPVDCAALLRELVAEQRGPGHRPLRLPVSTRATVYCERGLHSVKLYDLSQRGAAFTHDGCFEAGMQTMLLFENGEEHRGVIRWTEGGRAGIYLVEPVASTRLESAARF